MAAGAAVLVGGLLGAPAGHAAPVLAAQPAAPAPGAPGGAGPCAVASRTVDNPMAGSDGSKLTTTVFAPTGGAVTPLTGGRCDDAKRPLLILAHGWGQSDPSVYQGLIDHLVSVGNLVVYPDYVSGTGDAAILEATHREADAGVVSAVAAERRVDRTRVGVWGHSHGGGMSTFLLRQAAARGWGTKAIWLISVAQAYSQLIGTGSVTVPAHTRALFLAMEHDTLADARNGIDVFESLTLPYGHKRHVTMHTDTYGSRPYVADHESPMSSPSRIDAVDYTIWRYADLIEACALWGRDCDTNLGPAGTWSDGTQIIPAAVSEHPVDVGPAPVILAECDAGFGPSLNPRYERCGPTHL